MPVPGIWGPRLWQVLHRMGYYSAAYTPALPLDARREFIWLINHLETIVPCAECRQHIEGYRKARAFGPQDNASKWIWEFHEAVNERLGKKGLEYSDSLGKPSPSEKQSLRALWDNYKKSIFESVQMGHLPGKNLLEFGRHLFLWQGFVGA